MSKFRINGKFASVVQFVKTYGISAIESANLSTHQKRQIAGYNSYQNRIIVKGQFVKKEIANNKTINEIAKNKGVSKKDYIEKNYQEIKNLFETGVITISKNNSSIIKFIENHKGIIKYKGKEISKEEFILIISNKMRNEMSKKNVVEMVYKFLFNPKNNTISLDKILNIASSKTKSKK